MGRKSDLKDFDHEQMKLGKLYLQKGITKENSSLKGKEKAEEINNTSIGNRDEIVRLEKEMIGKSGNELYITPLYMCHMDSILKLEKIFMLTKTVSLWIPAPLSLETT